jgi:GT2 family glycosyltransferase
MYGLRAPGMSGALKNTDPLVTVSIVTWNHAHCIAKCIESILGQSHKNLEIIVSENHSEDGTLAVLQRYARQITIKINQINLGFCIAHNRNIRASKGEFILLANPDAEFHPDFVAEGLRVFQEDQRVGTVCGVLYSQTDASKGRILDGVGLRMTRSRTFRLLGRGLREADLPESDFEVFGSDGAAPMYRRTMVEDISVDGEFFDELFFAHKEDHDVAWRGRLLGWKAICARKCLAYHPRSFRPGDLALRKRVDPETKYHTVKNQYFLFIKNLRAANFLLHFPWLAARQLSILVYSLLAERSSLKAYGSVVRNLPLMIRKRRSLRSRWKLSGSEIRQWIKEPMRSLLPRVS